MAEYRAYIVGHDGHFKGCTPIIGADDDDATEQANGLVDGLDVELWSGTRLVVRIVHDVGQQKVSHSG